MGFMDKVKAQASTIAEKAQEQAKSGQEKLSQMQAKRQSDALLLELGHIAYAEHAGRGDASSATRAEGLVSRLKDFEAEHGPIGSGAPDPQAEATTSSAGDDAGSSPSAGTASDDSDADEHAD